MRDLLRLPVTEASQVAEARRLAGKLAVTLGFGAAPAGKVELVVTEMATNLVKHAPAGGELLVRSLACGDVAGVEVLALDQGPGMANVAACLRDGHSSAGSPGTGLGAMGRLAAQFDIYSTAGAGTAVLARLWAGPLPQGLPARTLQVGAVCLALAGEQECGDAWAVQQSPPLGLLLVVDGLGHGPGAAKAAATAVRTFRRHPDLAPAALAAALDRALRGTQGASLALLQLDAGERLVRFVGVGNIVGAICTPGDTQRMVTRNGTAGYNSPEIREYAYPWPAGAVIVVHSDGLHTKWNLDSYPGLLYRHPSLVAGVLFRDCSHPRDDATVVVIRDLLTA